MNTEYKVENKNINNNLFEYDEALSNINKSNESIQKRYNEKYLELKESLSKYKKQLNTYKLKLLSRFVPLVLSITIPITIISNEDIFDKEVGPVTEKVTATYENEDNVTYTKEIVDYSEEENKIYIKEIMPLNLDGIEQTLIYDASNYKLDNISDYFNLDVNNLTVVNEIKNSIVDMEIEDIGTISDIKRIVEFTYYGEEKYIEEDNTFSFLMISAFAYMLLLFIACVLKSEICDEFLLFPSGEIEYDLYNIKKRKEDIKDIKSRLKLEIERLLNEIDKNDRLRNEFIKAFNENKQYMLDYSLLEERYNELIDSVDTIKIRKELNNGVRKTI